MPAQQPALGPAHEQQPAVCSTSAAATVTSTGARRARPSGSSSTRPCASGPAGPAQRASGAGRLARRADRGPQLHDRLVPVARASHPGARRPGCRRARRSATPARAARKPREHPADVAVHHRQRRAVGNGEDGARGVETDAGHGQCGLQRPRERPAWRSTTCRAPGAGCGRDGSSRGLTTGPARPPPSRRPGPEGWERARGTPRSRGRRSSPWSAAASPRRARCDTGRPAPPGQVAPVAAVPGHERLAQARLVELHRAALPTRRRRFTRCARCRPRGRAASRRCGSSRGPGGRRGPRSSPRRRRGRPAAGWPRPAGRWP